MQPIQLPTSTTLLANQFFVHLTAVLQTDVERKRREAEPGSLEAQFYAAFDKHREINRLLDIAAALDSGTKTLEFT